MLDKLTNISKRYDAINEKLSDPAVFSDREAFAALMKERKSLEPVVEKYGLYKTALEEIDESRRGIEGNGGGTAFRGERSENET